MEWTPQQQAAIDARGSDLLVAAAAGSGKTAVLVERICSLAREGTPIERMLIVTFTNAAAAEMRARISDAFEVAGALGDAFLAQQSMHIERASISTLHRFCITVLRTHFQAAGVDPSFRTGDESETQVLRESAMQDAIDACFESGDANFTRLCDCFRDEQLPELAFSVYRFIMSRPDPWAWLDASIDACQTDAQTLGESIWVRTLLKSARLRLEGTYALLEQMQRIVNHSSGPTGYDTIVQSDYECLDALLEAAQSGYNALHDALAAVKYQTLPRKSGADDPSLADSFKKLRESLKKAVKSLAEDFAPTLCESAEDISSMTSVLRGLETLLRTFSALYTALKSQRNLLDYNDLEHLALRALEDDAVAEALREQYAYIFVDEYQDSNAIQEALLSRIAHPGGLFFVGDVKQSIYGFRQAEPSLFLGKYARFSSTENAPERKIDLNQNFRSRKNILASVNAVFAQCMRARVTDIEYDAQAMLYPGLVHEDQDPPTQMILLCAKRKGEDDPEKKDDAQPEQEQEEEENLSRIEQEALVCARSIRTIIQKRTLYDTKTKAHRPVRYRDVAILLRSMRVSGPVIVQLLASQGIPATCDAGEGYFDMPEVRQVLSLLQVIDNGYSDEALLAVLGGASVGLKEEALARIRIAYPEERFSAACAQYAMEKEDDIALALRAFDEKLSFYRLCARYEPLDALISRTMNESGLYARAGAMPGGQARQANLRLLCQRAREYQRAQNGSLGGFLAYAQKLRAGGDSQSAKLLSENEDVVRVMTMHKSKGLEFPFVFLLAIGQRFNFRAHADPLLMHARLGVGMLCYDDALRSIRSTLSHIAVREQLHHDALAEEVRVLYVAMTRAREQLFLIGSVRSESALEALCAPLNESTLYTARSFLHLLAPTLIQDSSILTLNRPTALHQGDARFVVTLLPAQQPSGADVIAQEAPLHELLAALEQEPVPVDEVSRRLAFRPREAAAAPRKTSVTQLLREGETTPQTEPLHRLPQFMEQSRFTGAARGTLFHKAMREMNLSALSAAPDKALCVREQLDSMAARTLLTKEERETLSVGQIAAFFESPMGARMLAARRVEREWPFTWRMDTPEGETLVQGVIDCCFIEKGAWVLLDYKTDGGDPGEIIARYREQIGLYARALCEITDLPVAEKSLYLVSRGRSFVL